MQGSDRFSRLASNLGPPFDFTHANLSREVLLGRVVALCMARELGLGSGDVGQARCRLGSIRQVVIRPKEVHGGLLGLLLLGLKPSIADCTDKLDDPVGITMRTNFSDWLHKCHIPRKTSITPMRENNGI